MDASGHQVLSYEAENVHDSFRFVNKLASVNLVPVQVFVECSELRMGELAVQYIGHVTRESHEA